MTNIVEQLFKSLDPWPGFQITSFKIQVSPVDGRKTLRKLFKNPLQFRLARTSNCHAGQIAVTSLLKGTFEELP